MIKFENSSEDQNDGNSEIVLLVNGDESFTSANHVAAILHYPGVSHNHDTCIIHNHACQHALYFQFEGSVILMKPARPQLQH